MTVCMGAPEMFLQTPGRQPGLFSTPAQAGFARRACTDEGECRHIFERRLVTRTLSTDALVSLIIDECVAEPVCAGDS